MIYQFGDCAVDTKLLEMRRDGEQQPLEPLEFDLLVYLIENRDRVVTRDELLEALWPGRIVTDSALSSRLKEVRSAVGDTGKAQRIIKTAHGRGYRFVANLEMEAATKTPFNAPVVQPTSAVGRDVETGKLNRWLDRAVAGQREIVLITGEAGVGKTTLTRAFLDLARSRDDLVLMHGQCINQRGASEAYLPLLEAFNRAGLQDQSIREILNQHAPAWLMHMPSLISQPVESVERAAIGTTTGRMLREISDALDIIAQQHTLVLVVEDLHWSDPSTIEWLNYFARRSDSAKLMLIATSRPDGPQRAVCRELVTRQHAHGLDLRAIDEGYVSDYLTHRLEQPPASALAALAFQRTGGFPLFIDALVAHWLENGLIQKSGGKWSATESDGALLEGVPASLSQLIEQQLTGLKEEERTIVETAALAGSPFAAAAVAHSIDDTEESVEALFGRMARQERVVRNAGEERWPDGTVTATFEFRHELYRETLYDSVPASRRARLHLALADRLERAYGDHAEEHAGELADHFARAHEVARALKYFYPAALTAFNRSALREALAILNRAIDLIQSLPTSDDAQRVERELHLLRASSLIALEGWASAGVEQSYKRAADIAALLGLEDTSAETYGIAAMEELRGHYAESQRLLDRLVSSSSNLGLEANELLACSLFHQGQFGRSKEYANAAVAKYDPREHSSTLARYGENPGVCCHSWASLDLWFLGFPDSAIERADDATNLAEEHVYSLSTALTQRTFLHQFRNEPEACISSAEKTIEVAAAQGFAFRTAQVSILGGWARARLAADDEALQDAIEQIDQALESYASTGAEMDLPYYLTLKADALRMAGRQEDALALQQHALSMTGGSRAFFYEAEMHRLHALLLLKQDQPDQQAAEQALDESLRIARQQGARIIELRTCITRLQVMAADGDDAAMKEDLQRVVNSLDEGRDTPDWQAIDNI